MPVNVLVVQDEAQTASLIRRGLEAEGFAVTIAGDGADGLRLVSSYEFDLVILDLLLPSVSGEEVLARMRQGSSNVPIIVLTAKDAVSDRVANLDAGADDYITKAVQLRRATRSGPGPSAHLGSGGIDNRLPRSRHPRPADERGEDRWTIGRADLSGVCSTRDVHASPGRGLVAASAPGSSVGIRSRTEVQRGRGLRGIPP